MTTGSVKRETGIARRDLLTLVGTAAAAGFAAAGPALAQSPAPVSPQPPTKSTVTLDRLPRGVLLIGIDRADAQNRIDIPTFSALGQAYYAFEHDDDLSVAVLHGKGADFSGAWTSHPGAPPCAPDRFRPRRSSSIRWAPLAPSARSHWSSPCRGM